LSLLERQFGSRARLGEGKKADRRVALAACSPREDLENLSDLQASSPSVSVATSANVSKPCPKLFPCMSLSSKAMVFY